MIGSTFLIMVLNVGLPGVKLAFACLFGPGLAKLVAPWLLNQLV